MDIEPPIASPDEMLITSEGRNGILIEGTKGRIFVSRGDLEGAPVEELASNPLPEDALTKLYKGKEPGDHMRNFFECISDRTQPISDVHTHHRAMTTCHLANIALRTGRKLTWNADRETIVGDAEATQQLERPYRSPWDRELRALGVT